MSAAPSGTPSERLRRWSMPAALGPRTQVALGVIAGFAALAWADGVGLGGARPAWWLLPVAVAVAVRGGGEFAALFARGGLRLRAVVLRGAVAALPVLAAWGATVVPGVSPCAASVAALGWAALGSVAAVAALLAAEVLCYDAEGRSVERAAAGALVVVMLGLPLAFLVGLRVVGGDGAASARGPFAALLPLVSVITVVKGSDIAAYFVGSLFGRHRMAPRLSPGKTWEGAAAGLVAAVVVSWFLIERCGAGARPAGGPIVFGLVVGALGMLGDLGESLVKRECGAKDSGTALGRMGGVLDLVDSLTFAAPGAWALWMAGCGV